MFSIGIWHRFEDKSLFQFKKPSLATGTHQALCVKALKTWDLFFNKKRRQASSLGYYSYREVGIRYENPSRQSEWWNRYTYRTQNPALRNQLVGSNPTSDINDVVVRYTNHWKTGVVTPSEAINNAMIFGFVYRFFLT